MNRPYSQACENNKQPILDKLLMYFQHSKQVLEIGSGTGQHAVFFAANLPHLQWHTSDMPENHAGINQWIDAFPTDNLHRPVALTVGQDSWPALEQESIDAVFSANTTHIMQRHEVPQMFDLIQTNLPVDGVFCQYGPFNVDGTYTSDSNRDFDQYLLAQGCGGLWDIDELTSLSGGLNLVNCCDLPANNKLLVWQNILGSKWHA